MVMGDTKRKGDIMSILERNGDGVRKSLQGDGMAGEREKQEEEEEEEQEEKEQEQEEETKG